jgi:CRP-like cAMP-binding protein
VTTDVDQVRAAHAAWERAIERDRHADAVKALLELEALEPREPNWSHRLGDAYRRLGQNEAAASAFGRAMDRYHVQGFLPRAIAMAKLAASLDPSKADLIELLTPESARAVRPPAVPPPVPLRAAPLARAKDELPDEVRFEDDPAPSSISIVEIDVDEIREPMPTIPEEDLAPPSSEPSIDRLATMVGFRLFAELDRDALVALSSAADLVEFVPGAMVVMRDEPAFALYAIIQGTVRVDLRGSPSVRLGEGEVFGEACLLDEGKRQADVRAETPVTTLRIGKSAVDAIVTKFPEVQSALFQLLARRLVANVVQTNPLFAAFEPSQRLELAQTFEVRRAEAGSRLAELGRKVDGLYVLLAGDLMAIAEANEETRVARGSTFGQGSLLGGRPSEVTLLAATELVLLRLPASKFNVLAAQYPPALAHLSEIAADPVRGSLAPEPGKS